MMWKYGLSLVAVCALAMSGCGSAKAADSGKVTMKRDGFRITPRENAARVQLTIDNAGGATAQAKIHLTLALFDGTILDDSTRTVQAAPGETAVTVPLDALPAPAASGEGVLRYVVTANGNTDRGGFNLISVLPALDTRVVVPDTLLAGSEAALRVVCRDAAGERPASGAKITAKLVREDGEAALFTAATGENGEVEKTFLVPPEVAGRATLHIAVNHSELGQDAIEQPVEVTRAQRILLTTDKPRYQPGQTIHLRALSQSLADRTPVQQETLTFEVMDAKGNKVFKQTENTGEFGVAAADFTLATELNEGSYTVRALLGEATAEKTVTVEKYVLPKFDIEVTTNKDFYQPGDTLEGEVQSGYFFGKPVAGGEVRVMASKFEAGFEQFAELEGVLDENGHWSFDLDLPDFFAGTPIEQGQASVRLQVVVVDTADQREEKTVMKSIAGDDLRVEVIAESGTLQPGVENNVYILVAEPSGTPAAGATVTVSGLPGGAAHELETDKLGIASFPLTLGDDPVSAVRAQVNIRDVQGRTLQTSTNIAANQRRHGLILRPDKALYRVGDRLEAEVIASKPAGRVYLDLIREGQTMLTETAEIDDGRATIAVNLDPSLAGSVIMNAYMFTPGTDLIRDTRTIYVDPANELRIDAALDADTYRPGEPADITFTVTNADGNPAAAAIGISIVDESVFALQEMHPGLEKVYFTIEEEIMKPRYEIHGYDMNDVILKPAWDEGQQRAAQVLLASAPKPDRIQYTNTHAKRVQEAASAVQQRINEDLQKVQQALNKLYQERDKFPASDTILSTLLRKGYLRENDLEDPWGNRYEFDFSNLGEHGGPFSMRSPGPDGEFDTDDDAGVGGGGFGGAVNDSQALGARRMKAGAVGGRAGAPVVAAPMPQAEMAMADSAPAPEGGEQQQVRVREYFPETLLFEPALIAGSDGKATLTVDMADSITTWRMTTMASAANGALGSMDKPIRVFQDFFVDIDLPVSLTQNDEISIPVAIYNYLDSQQDIRLKFEEAGWFTLEGDAQQTISVAADEVTVRYFPITVKELGMHKLTVYAYGSKLSDAIRREIEVLPDGEKIEESVSDRISGNVTQTIAVPANAIDGASKILVKLYPGVFTQVVDGLDSMLRMPSGCFEQTSSVTYPNVLIVEYMEETGQINPELRMKAEGFINAGYQRLLSYEVDGGGFSWFGDAPANQVLTAWGVKQFHDMAAVHEVDPNINSRTVQWLLGKQQADGSWQPDESYLHQESWSGIQSSTVLVTAYIAEALLHAETRDNRIDKAIAYVRKNWKDQKDPYTLGIIANALVRWDAKDAFTGEVLETLHNLRVEEGDTVHWASAQETVTFTHGDAANVETTALAALAFLEAGRYPQTVSKALTYLVQKKQASGHWGSTQATILALQAMLKALSSQAETVDANIDVRINGEVVTTLEVTPENSDVMRLVDLGEQTVEGDNVVGLDFQGEGSMLYQVVGRYYVPWTKRDPRQQPMTIDVSYDKTQLAVDETVTAKVSVTNNRPETANMVIVDLGIPPGFDVVTADLAKLVEDGVVEKYEMTGRQVILYFEKIDGNETVEFSYHLRARFPLRAKTPESRAYEYYNPEVEALSEPVAMVVE
ncbi:MAG: MG2 domain-containing protein [Candidatus Hydrogenedentota bacterium]